MANASLKDLLRSWFGVLITSLHFRLLRDIFSGHFLRRRSRAVGAKMHFFINLAGNYMALVNPSGLSQKKHKVNISFFEYQIYFSLSLVFS